MKTKVLIIIGGESTEHEVSLVSGTSVLENIDREKYEPTLFGIGKEGTWYKLPLQGYLKKSAKVDEAALELSKTEPVLVSFAEKGFVLGGGEVYRPDVIFPVLHGTNGEDGTVQGLFQLLGIPVVGCGILGSAVCMDKEVAKRLLDGAGIKNARFSTLRVGDEFYAGKVAERLGFPLFVKSANGGSSVGVSKASDIDELLPAIEDSFRYDSKVIIEEAIVGRELECAVMGNEDPKASTVLGEIVPNKESYYSYDAKYINEDGVNLVAPAIVSDDILEKIQGIAIRTYKLLECRGLARIDFFLTENNEIYVNEVNTMPGFTSISMFPKLWALSGVPYSDLIDGLIKLALDEGIE